MIKKGKLNDYLEIIGEDSWATWNEEKMNNALSLEENETVHFCPWTNDMETLSKIDETIFSRRPDLTLFIDRRYQSDGTFGREKDGKVIPCFFEDLCQIMIDKLSEMKHVKNLIVDILKLPSIDVLGKLTGLISLLIDCDGKNSLSFLPHLKNLQTLNLNGNFKDIGYISECKNLKSLRLQANEINGKLNKFEINDLSFLQKMNLEYLEINLAKISCNIELCKSLKTFILANSNVDDISFLSEYSSLTELLLHRLNITQLNSLSGLHNLKALSLEYLKDIDISALNHNTSIEYLQVEDCKSVNSKQLVDLIKTLKNLRKVKADGVKLMNLYEQLKKVGLDHLVPQGKDTPELFEKSRYLNIY